MADTPGKSLIEYRGTIQARHPSGFVVTVLCQDVIHIDKAVQWLQERHYVPVMEGDQWRRTPEGLPICPKHGVVMPQREKQGDIWHAHSIVPNGNEDAKTYCRGYPSKHGTGWWVEQALTAE